MSREAEASGGPGRAWGRRGAAGAGQGHAPHGRKFRGKAAAAPARPPGPGLTCLKQKGMVSTLTPTMLFTMFMVSPQVEAAAAAIARARGREPGRRREAPHGPAGRLRVPAAHPEEPPDACHARLGPLSRQPRAAHFRLPRVPLPGSDGARAGPYRDPVGPGGEGRGRAGQDGAGPDRERPGSAAATRGGAGLAGWRSSERSEAGDRAPVQGAAIVPPSS